MVQEKAPEPDSAVEQAIDWIICLQENPEDLRVLSSFESWLDESPSHLEAFQKAKHSWNLMGAVAPDIQKWPNGKVGLAHSSVAATNASNKIFLGARWNFGIIAVAACLMVFIYPSMRLSFLADYQTSVGEVRVHVLPDGTKVTLGAGSAIRLSFSEQQKQVELLSGHAFFDVSENSKSPFIVLADNLVVTVSGTAFDLNFGSNKFVLGVKSGQVGVAYAHGDSLSNYQVSAGRGISIRRSDGIAEINPVSVASVAGWRNGRLFVHNQTVSDVVEVLNRYAGGQTFIADSSLKEKNVTGSFDLYSPVSAFQALIEPYRGKMVVVTPFVRILRSS